MKMNIQETIITEAYWQCRHAITLLVNSQTSCDLWCQKKKDEKWKSEYD